MNKLVTLIVYILVGALLITTSAMSYDFIQRVMPPGQQYLAFAALAAFGVGAVGWTMYFKQAVGWPKWVSLLLIGVDVLGEGSLFMADVYLNSASRFGLESLTGDQANMFLIAFGAVIVINIVGAIAIEVLDPDSLLRAHELDTQHARQEAELDISKIELAAEIENRKAMANAIRERARKYNEERMPGLLEAWQFGANSRYSQVEETLRLGFKPGKGDELAAGTQLAIPATAEKKIGFAMDMDLAQQHALHYRTATGREATVAIAESVLDLQTIAAKNRGQYQEAWITSPDGAKVWTAPIIRTTDVNPIK